MIEGTVGYQSTLITMLFALGIVIGLVVGRFGELCRIILSEIREDAYNDGIRCGKLVKNTK